MFASVLNYGIEDNNRITGTRVEENRELHGENRDEASKRYWSH
jgi:hypothetical protein